MYDPYLTWRSFLRNSLANYQQLSYKPHDIHVEIIPFIYGKIIDLKFLYIYTHLLIVFYILDCFQSDDIINYAIIGESLVHILGAIVCGSQVRCPILKMLYIS